MPAAPIAKKKEKEEEEDIRKKFAVFLNNVLSKGRASSIRLEMDTATLEAYREAALKARQQQGKIDITPVKTGKLDQKSIEEAMKLATMFETAKNPRDIKFRGGWIKEVG